MKPLKAILALLLSLLLSSYTFAPTKPVVSPYSTHDLWMLAHVIQAEAGSDCCTDEHQQLVGMVVMNRVKDERFPDSVVKVIFQKGQYYCINNRTFWNEPTARAWKNALDVLTGKVECPESVIFQAEFVQGHSVYKVCETPYSTTYFCEG